MKKIYNKALMFQYLYMGKWAILASVVFYSIFCFSDIKNRIGTLRYDISTMNGDMLRVAGFEHILIIIVTLFVAYIARVGLNKRGAQSYLMSSPFTKEEIKKNEILYLFIVLAVMIIVYVYINLCVVFSERELMSLSYNYINLLIIDIIRIFLIGMTFIAYMCFMDMMFSNTVAVVAGMYGLPVLSIIILSSLVTILDICGVLENLSFNFHKYVDSLREFIMGETYYFENRVEYTVSIKVIILFMLMILTFIALVWIINKRFAFNSCNKMFAFKSVENLVLYYISFGLSFILLSKIFRGYYYRNNQYTEVIGQPAGIITILGIIITSVVIGYLLFKTFKKMVNKYI